MREKKRIHICEEPDALHSHCPRHSQCHVTATSLPVTRVYQTCVSKPEPETPCFLFFHPPRVCVCVSSQLTPWLVGDVSELISESK